MSADHLSTDQNRCLRRAYLRAFRRSEEGSVTVFSCFLILMMLMICGIAVDLMQNELMRTRVQNTLDRAILAASDIEQPLPADEVVDDYFLKAGMTDFLDTVEITPGDDLPTTNYRMVEAYAATTTPSPYMRMTGVSSLPVFALGIAEESIENTEISMVLDTSASMHGSKIANMKVAAKDFVTAVLDGNAGLTTSINIVPYGGHVNPGPVVYGLAGGIDFSSHYENADGDVVVYGFTATDEDGNEFEIPYNSFMHCLELPASEYTDMNLPAGGFNQTPYFSNWGNTRAGTDWGWCPYDNMAISYAQNNLTSMHTYIENFRLNDGTGTNIAMKYGVALLNPTSNSTFRTLNDNGLVPDSFTDRPAAFDDERTRKVIVLMTDGGITAQFRPEVLIDPDNATDRLQSRTSERTTVHNRSTTLAQFYAQCDLAKANGIQIYTIAFEAPTNVQNEMRNCATAPGFFYDVRGVEISTAFKAIARQINQLRLTQ